MVPRLPFRFDTRDGLYWASFVAYEYPPVRQHWPGLFDQGELLDAEVLPWDALAVNNNNREEIAVYLGLLRSILSKRAVMALPHFHVTDVRRQLGQTGTLAQWQFEIDTAGGPGSLSIVGFVPARSGVRISPPPSEEERGLRDKTLLFDLQGLDDLVALLKALLCDATAEVNIFGVHQARRQSVIDALNGSKRPMLASLLAGDDLFADLTIGVDLGHNDAIVIASPAPLEDRLRPHLERIEAAIRRYESKVTKYWTPAEAIKAMLELAGEL